MSKQKEFELTNTLNISIETYIIKFGSDEKLINHLNILHGVGKWKSKLVFMSGKQRTLNITIVR